MIPIADFISLLLCTGPRLKVPANTSFDLGGGGVDCLPKAVDDGIDCRSVYDEWRRNQDMVTAPAIRGAAHWIDHQPARHSFALDAGMHLQRRIERLPGAAI